MSNITVRVESPKKGRYSIQISGDGGLWGDVMVTSDASSAFEARDYLQKAIYKAQAIAMKSVEEKPKGRKAKSEPKEPKETGSGARGVRYTDDQKAEVVDFIRKHPYRGAYKEASEKYGVSASVIKKWVTAGEGKAEEPETEASE
jgi:hypothetical protein